MTTGIFQTGMMFSCRSGCWSTSGWRITGIWDKSSMVLSETPGADCFISLGATGQRPSVPGSGNASSPALTLPPLREMLDLLEPWNFSVLDVENLRLHYERTLEHWLTRFEASVDRVTEMFGPEFVR